VAEKGKGRIKPEIRDSKGGDTGCDRSRPQTSMQKSPAMKNLCPQTPFDRFAVLLPVLVGILAAGPLVLSFVGKQQTEFGDLALGQQTKAMFARRGEHPVNVARGTECELCLAGYRERGGQPGVLWLGNSQLHGINQYADGQQSCPGLLHGLLNKIGFDTLAVSLPNATPVEHHVVFDYMKARMDLRLVIVGVCFDDLRSTQIREDVASLRENSAQNGETTDITRVNRAAEQGVADGDTPAADAATANTYRSTQQATEAWLERFLSQHSALWRARSEARGQFLVRLHLLRNTVLGITAQTQRKMLRPAYARNLESLEAILTQSRAAGIDVLMYVVPLRNDVSPPYRAEEYAAFRAQLRNLVQSNGGKFANLESLVPAADWGTKDSTVFNGDPEIDFMHFQAAAHLLLADRLHDIIVMEKLGVAAK